MDKRSIDRMEYLASRLAKENLRLRRLLKDAELVLDPDTDMPLVMEIRAELEGRNNDAR